MSKLAALVVSGGPCLDGPLHLGFERSAAWPDDEVATITAMVQVFVAAGELGAYPCPNVAPGRNVLALEGDAIVAGPNLGYRLRASHLEPRAFQLLRHLVSRLEPAGGEALLRIVAGTTGPGVPPRATFPVIDWENEEDAYLAGPAQPGFAVHFDDSLAYSKSRRVLVELAAEIEGPPIDVFEDYVRRWCALVEGGAFALPLGLPDVIDNETGMLVQLDAFTLELELGHYQSSELGFEVLLHLLASYHVHERPIRLVTIE